MATRLATQVDTTEIIEFLRKYHAEDSNLSDIPFDKTSMVKAINYYISMPKHVCFVYVEKGKIDGVFMASIEPFMFNEKRKWATDLLNVANTGGAWLMKRFIAWAKMHRVDRIMMGVSTGNPRSDSLYEAMGLKRTGGMYTMSFEKDEE